MKTITINEDQLRAIVQDAATEYHRKILDNGEFPYRGFERDFAKQYANRILAILDAKEEDFKNG